MGLPRFKKPAEKRSRNMRAIQSSGNKTTEIRLVSLLKEHGLTGWRLHPPHILCNPDLVIRKGRVAVFVDGCFWHACPDHGSSPKANAVWWEEKLRTNVARDRDTDERLRSAGWEVVRVWEHEDPAVVAVAIADVVAGRRGTG